ncbi:MAG: hypothetical protein DU429_07140 [Candidatus Tokpelaia sp.]|nr:MAG: hypothetical protein DU430_04590 [Candidatus Tokpelaia sp.]KAA6205993.1 MAG: hypothetical protein DU429_07140 [Candidatus Tokpelaia sp.]
MISRCLLPRFVAAYSSPAFVIFSANKTPASAQAAVRPTSGKSGARQASDFTVLRSFFSLFIMRKKEEKKPSKKTFFKSFCRHLTGSQIDKQQIMSCI